MSINSADGDGLIETSGVPEDNMAPCRIIQPKRKVVVEPILVMAAFFGFPVMLLTQLFLVQKIKEDLAEQKGINLTGDTNQSDVSKCSANTSDPMYIFQEEVQQKAAFFSVISSIVMGFPALFTSVFLGAYSDKVGRKYAMYPPLAGGVAKCIAFLLVINFKGSIWWLLIGYALDGLGGFYPTILLGCFAYIADITTLEQRMFRITVLELLMLFSAMLGPIGVGIIIEKMGFFWPLLVVIVGDGLVILYVVFLVPETVRKDPNAKFFSVGPLGRTFGLFTKDNGTNRCWKLVVLFLALFVSTIVTLESATSTLFQLNSPLCWDSTMIGYYNAASIGISGIGGALFARLFKCCLQDQYICLIAGVCAVLRMIYTALVQNTIMMFCAPMLGSLSVLFIPTIRTLMSKLVSENEQGAVFGAIAFAEVMCSMFGSVVFNSIYYATIFFMTGFVYFSMAIFYFVGSMFLLYYIVRVHKETKAAKKYRLLVAADRQQGEYSEDEPAFHNKT